MVYSPEIVLYLNRYNFIYDNSSELQALSHQWLQYMPLTHRCFEIGQEELAHKTDNYAWGFSLDMEYVRELDVPVAPPVIHLPSEPSIHSVFTSSGKTAFGPRHLKFMIDYAAENGLTVAGNARGNLVCSVLEEDQLTGYFEVWLPIELREGLTIHENP